MDDEQLEAYQRTFKLFANEEGLIPTSELGTVMRALSQNPTEEELEEYIQENDVYESGFIDYESFQALMIKRLKKDEKEEELREALQAFDKKGAGTANCEEIRETFVALCHDLKEEEVEEMLGVLDPEGTGEFSIQDAVEKIISAQKAPPKKDKKKGKKKKKK